MPKASVDQELCIGCELCTEICPEVFEMGDDGKAHAVNPDACEDAGCCEEARESCPVDAVTIE